MDLSNTARVLGAGRALIGAALLAAPGTVALRWLGEVSERPGAQVAISGVGARDLVLGLGTVWALGGRRRDVRPWLIASGIADMVDLTAALRFRKGLTPPAVGVTAAVAGGSAVLCFLLQSELG